MKKAILQHWEKKLRREAETKKSLEHLNLDATSLRAPHPAWRLGAADPLTVTKATTKVKLLTQRYPLFYSRVAGNNYGSKCPLCNNSEETLEHFLVTCPVLEPVRHPRMQELLQTLQRWLLRPPASPGEAVSLILDPSSVAYGQEVLGQKLETTTRDLIFALHNKRSVLLGYQSRYKIGKSSANLLRRYF